MLTHTRSPSSNVPLTSRRGTKAAVKSFFVFVLCTIVIFFILEGFCSSLLGLRKIHENIVRAKAYPYHTQFDKQLGWANIPDYYQRNYFGPGVYVKINSQGF